MLITESHQLCERMNVGVLNCDDTSEMRVYKRWTPFPKKCPSENRKWYMILTIFQQNWKVILIWMSNFTLIRTIIQLIFFKLPFVLNDSIELCRVNNCHFLRRPILKLRHKQSQSSVWMNTKGLNWWQRRTNGSNKLNNIITIIINSEKCVRLWIKQNNKTHYKGASIPFTSYWA